MAAQPLHEAADVLLLGGKQQPIGALDLFRKLQEVALVGLAGGRPHTFFDLKIGAVLPHQQRVPRDIFHNSAIRGHTRDYPCFAVLRQLLIRSGTILASTCLNTPKRC